MDSSLIKILTISTSPWDDANSSGNTLSNLFLNWDNVELSNIFCRESFPNNNVCKYYYRITAKMLAMNLFSSKRIGKAFIYDSAQSDKYNTSENAGKSSFEKKFIAVIHRYNLNFAYFIENILWKLNLWQNKKFDEFLQERSPNVIFAFAIPSVQRQLLLEYAKKKTNAKVVLMITDNVCNEYFSSNGKRGKEKAKRMKNILRLADKIYAITDELIGAYSKEFGVDISILRKACNFNVSVCNSSGSPIRIVYAGNLLYGRIEILRALGEAICKINFKEQKMFLEIYSGTEISNSEKKSLNISGASVFCGSRPFDEIKSIFLQSDIVLHVESFDPKQIDYVKFSFSTKITDALESGRNFMVIGPKGISSVEYPKRIPGTIIIDNLNQIQDTINSIVSGKVDLIKNAELIREYAMKHHSREVVLSTFKNDVNQLCNDKMI